MKQVNLIIVFAIFMVFTTTNNAAPAPKPHKNAIFNKIKGPTDYTDDLPSPYAQLYLAADYYVQLKFRKSLSILTEVINQCPLAEDEPYNLFFVLIILGVLFCTGIFHVIRHYLQWVPQ